MTRAAKSLTVIERTQADIANLLGVTPRAVRHWLTDRRHLSHRAMPEPVRRLLFLIDRVPEIVLPELLAMALEHNTATAMEDAQAEQANRR